MPVPLSGIEITDFPVLVPISSTPGGPSLTRAKINYSYNLNPLAFSLESDRVLPTLSIRLGPFTKSKAVSYLEAIEVPEHAKKRVDKSGHYKKQDAYWIWVEGMKDIKRLEL